MASSLNFAYLSRTKVVYYLGRHVNNITKITKLHIRCNSNSNKMASSKVPNIKLSSGHAMPVVGYGTFNLFKENEVRDAARVALEVGYRHFDTAWLYKTEEELSDAITQKIKDGLLKRSDLFLTSKLWNTHHRPESVEEMCRDSLTSLQTDYLDLYLIHCPVAVKGSCKQGDALKTKMPHDDVDFIDTWKVEVHPYYTNNELLDYCKQENIVVTAYAPLGRGMSNSADQFKPANLLVDKTIQKIAAKYNKTAAQVLLRWGVERGYTLIPKSVTPARIKQNIEIFDFSLNEADVETISTLNKWHKCYHLDLYRDHPEYPF
ncbi:aldo-keto reductase family 1 member A1-A isoform X3 [Patella vulgata]|uniref:aldo-keto reductase family 1 member A1-A isoform X3 n=1 Tax=Patella vulgata TaxID=6465 RepID=UPI0024AA0276|nr:aldo-keto reductase family 1 member A1-A isoform X3 [Patella vulgata]